MLEASIETCVVILRSVVQCTLRCNVRLLRNADSQFCSTKRLHEKALTEMNKVAQLYSSSRQAVADFSSISPGRQPHFESS